MAIIQQWSVRWQARIKDLNLGEGGIEARRAESGSGVLGEPGSLGELFTS